MVNERSVLLPGSESTSETPNKSLRHRDRTRTLGLLAIFGTVVMVVTQGEASQALQVVGHFNKPFFIVGFNHTTTVVLLPLVYLYHHHRDRNVDVGNPNKRNDVVAVLQRHCVIPLGHLLRVAALLNTLGSLADYLWFKALATISVALGTALSNTLPFFVYSFSVCLLHERVTWRKVGGVILSFIGVIIIVLFQGGDSSSSGEWDIASVTARFGDASALACLSVVVSTAIYAVYEVGVRVMVGEDVADLSTLLIMTGLCGLVSIPLWIIGSVAFALCPFPSLYEPLGWPEAGEPLALLFLSGLLLGINATLLVVALCWTSPLETSVGAMLTLPVAGVWDLVFHDLNFPLACVGGAVLVVLGFIVLEFSKFRGTAQSTTVRPPGYSSSLQA